MQPRIITAASTTPRTVQRVVEPVIPETDEEI